MSLVLYKPQKYKNQTSTLPLLLLLKIKAVHSYTWCNKRTQTNKVTVLFVIPLQENLSIETIIEKNYRIFSSQLNQIFSKFAGETVNAPLRTSSTARKAISLQLRNHWGLTRNSTTSLERLHMGTAIWWPALPLNSPSSCRRFTTAVLALKRGIPAYSPQHEVRAPPSSITFRTGRWCRLAAAKSTGSWPGVILTAPEKSMLCITDRRSINAVWLDRGRCIFAMKIKDDYKNVLRNTLVVNSCLSKYMVLNCYRKIPDSSVVAKGH